jgi:hypothetical protein
MSADSRFKPPAAEVADIDPSNSRTRAIALAIPGGLALFWTLMRLPRFFKLVEVGAMNPAGTLIELVGMVFLAVGLWRAWPHGLGGRKSFVAAAALTVGGTALFDASGAGAGLLLAFFPFYLGALVSVAGIVLVRSKGKPA